MYGCSRKAKDIGARNLTWVLWMAANSLNLSSPNKNFFKDWREIDR